MRLELTGRHVDITPALRRLVDRKLARLDRMLNDSALSAQVVLAQTKRERRADVTLHARGEKFLHAVGRSANWEASMSQAVDKIVQQAETVKGKWQTRKRRGRRGLPAAAAPAAAIGAAETTANPEPAPPEPRAEPVRRPRTLQRTSSRILSMSVDEALRVVDANGGGIVVFRDPATSGINVLVRRPDGGLTLVETEG